MELRGKWKLTPRCYGTSLIRCLLDTLLAKVLVVSPGLLMLLPLDGLKFMLDSPSAALLWIVIIFVNLFWEPGANLVYILYTILHWFGELVRLIAICGLPGISQVSQPNENICREKQVKASHSNITEKFQFSWSSGSHEERGMETGRDVAGEVAGARSSA